MVDQVIITGVDPNAVKAAGWAQEATLVKLADSGRASSLLLKQIANIVAKGDQHLIDQIELAAQSTERVQEQTNEGLDALRSSSEQQSSRLGSSLSLLGSVFKNSFSNFSKITSTEGLFAGLGDGLSKTSRYLDGLGTTTRLVTLGLGAVVTEAGVFYEKIVKMTKATESLYATGLVFQGGMQGLADGASRAGLSVETFSKMLTKYSAVAGSLGVDTLTKLNGMFLEQTRMGADLMMSQEQASEAFFDSAELLRSSGKLVGMSNKDIVSAGRSLLQNYNDLAAATGRNRDEIRKNTSEIMKMPDVNALARLMPDPAKFGETIAGISAEFGDGGKEMASMVAQMKLAGGSMGTLPGEMASVINQIPGLQQAMRAAGEGDPEAAVRMRKAIGNMDPQKVANLMIQFPEAGKTINAWMQQTQQATDIEATRSHMTAADIENEKRAKAEAARALQVQNNVSAAFARFGNAFDKLAVAMGNILLPAVEAVSWIFEKLANGVNSVTSLITGGGKTGTVAETVVAVVPAVLAMLYSGKGVIGMTRLVKKFGGAALDKLTGGGKIADLPTGGKPGMLAGIGKGLGGVPKFAGSLLTEIANGVAAFGNTRVLLGTVAIAALAGDLYLFGQATKVFNDVEWGSLAKAGIVMVAAGLGMEAFAGAVSAASAILAANVVDIAIAEVILAGFGVAMIPLAFAMQVASPAIEAFGVAISSIFASLRGTSWETLLAAGPALLELTGALTAAAVAAPFVWIGSQILSNAIERIGEGISAAIQNSGPQAIDALVGSIGKLASIDGGSLEKTAKGLRAIAGVMTQVLPGMNVQTDSGAIDGFINVFTKLGAAREDIIHGAGSIAALSTIDLSADKMAGIARLTSMFSSSGGLGGGILNMLFNSSIDEGLIIKFRNMFKLLGQGEEDIIKGSNTLIAIGDANITEDKIKGIQVLSDMFSKSAGKLGGKLHKLFHSEIDTTLVTKFTDMFAALGRGRQQIIAGAGSLAAMFSINITSDKVTGMKILADMFSSPWYGKLFMAEIDTELVDNFVKMFAALGKGEDAIVNGSESLFALMDINTTADKINGLKALSDMFSSTWLGSLFSASIDTGMVDSFAKMFGTLGAARQPIISGAGTLAALFSIDISPDKLASVSKLPDMFSNFSNTQKNLKNIDGFVSIFQKFGNNEDTIISGVNAINAINNLDLSGLNQLHDLNAAIYGNGAPIVVQSAAPAATTTTVINDAAADYYSRTIGQFDKMIELLTIANVTNQKILNINTEGFEDTVSAVNSASGTVY